MSRVRKIQPKKQSAAQTWETLMKDFLALKRAEKRSETTLHDYEYHIRQFFSRYPTGDVQKNLIEYLASSVADATYNIRLSYLKGFFQYLVDENLIVENPLAKFHRRKTEPRIVDVDIKFLKELLTLPDLTTYAGLRDKALICLTLDNGIRPKEAFQLRVSDFDRHNSHVIVRPEVSKTRKQRTLPITQTTVNLITKLISVRPPDWNNNVPLFASSDGTPLTRHTWRDRMRKYSKMMNTKINPYDLRHCFALNFLRNGGNALFLQQIMGHSDMNMTKHYVAATDRDLKTALQHASPLNTLVKPKRIRAIQLDAK